MPTTWGVDTHFDAHLVVGKILPTCPDTLETTAEHAGCIYECGEEAHSRAASGAARRRGVPWDGARDGDARFLVEPARRASLDQGLSHAC